MDISQTVWDNMHEEATKLQQMLYELLPDWTCYYPKDYMYLRYNIAIAILGGRVDTIDLIDPHDDTTDLHNYTKKENELISKIFEKVFNHGVNSTPETSIYFGIVYNITFPTMSEIQTVSKDQLDKDITEYMCIIPVFKVRKYLNENSKSSKAPSKIADLYETWYIDTKGRVYKDWEKYLENNTLHECVMCFPKYGFYQPSPTEEITEDSSCVWVDFRESPAASTLAQTLKYADCVATVGSVAAIACAFTPIAPVVAAGAAIGTVSGIYSFGRSSHKIYDRVVHEESIDVRDREAFVAWLGVVGCAVGLTVSGGAVVLKHLATKGKVVNVVITTMYDAAVAGNIGINLIGLTLQGYDLVTNPKEATYMDYALFATHLFFFSSTVVKAEFAKDIISSTQGKVLDDYRATLKSKRLRKSFNRAKRTAAGNSADPISQNAEVIRYVNKVESYKDLRSLKLVDTVGGPAKVVNGVLALKGISLHDPVDFVIRLIKSGQKAFQAAQTNCARENQEEGSQGNETNNGSLQVLRKTVLDLLSELYTSKDCPRTKRLHTVPDFESLIRTILDKSKDEKVAKDVLMKIFKIAVGIITHSDGTLAGFLSEIAHFVWEYARYNLTDLRYQICSRVESMSKALLDIVNAIFDRLDALVDQLYKGADMWIRSL